MDPRLYLEFANRLIVRVKNSNDLASAAGPAECRSVISRAYYSAFLVARDLLEFIGFQLTETGQCHDATQKGLNNSGESDLATASSNLVTMYSARRWSDYEMNNKKPESIQLAETIAKLSKETISLLDKCHQEYRSNSAKGISVAQVIWSWAKQNGQEKKLWKK